MSSKVQRAYVVSVTSNSLDLPLNFSLFTEEKNGVTEEVNLFTVSKLVTTKPAFEVHSVVSQSTVLHQLQTYGPRERTKCLEVNV